MLSRRNKNELLKRISLPRWVANRWQSVAHSYRAGIISVVLLLVLACLPVAAFSGDRLPDNEGQKSSSSKSTTPTGKSCDIDLGYPKTRGQKQLTIEDPPASICWNGWECYSGVKSSLFYGFAYQLNDINLQEHSVGDTTIPSKLDSLKGLAQKILNSSKMLNSHNQIQDVWIINPKPGETIYEKRSACFGAAEMKGVNKLKEWARWYLSQYKQTRNSIAAAGEKYRRLYRETYGSVDPDLKQKLQKEIFSIKEEKRYIESRIARDKEVLKSNNEYLASYKQYWRSKQAYEKHYEESVKRLKKELKATNKLISDAVRMELTQKLAGEATQQAHKILEGYEKKKAELEENIKYHLKVKENPHPSVKSSWKKYKDIQERQNSLKAEIANKRKRLQQIAGRIRKLEKDLAEYKQHISSLDARVDEIDKKLKQYESEYMKLIREFNRVQAVHFPKETDEKLYSAYYAKELNVIVHRWPAESVSGVWDTTEGEATLKGNGGGKISGFYRQDKGRLFLTLSGRHAEGIWVENDSNKKCTTKKDGSYHWGRVVFNFDKDLMSFTGWWSYCASNKRQKKWTGTRKVGKTVTGTSVKKEADEKETGKKPSLTKPGVSGPSKEGPAGTIPMQGGSRT